MCMGLQELCAIQDLEELQGESTGDQEGADTSLMELLFRSRSDFYPVNSRGKSLDPIQKSIEKELTRLASRTSSTGFIHNDNLTRSERDAV